MGNLIYSGIISLTNSTRNSFQLNFWSAEYICIYLCIYRYITHNLAFLLFILFLTSPIEQCLNIKKYSYCNLHITPEGHHNWMGNTMPVCVLYGEGKLRMTKWVGRESIPISHPTSKHTPKNRPTKQNENEF